MAVTNEQYQALINRIEFIESAMNNILAAIKGLGSLDQLRQVVNLRQADINSLETRMVAVENSIDILQGLHEL